MLVFAYEPEALERETLRALLEHEGFRLELMPSREALLVHLKREPQALAIAQVDAADAGVLWIGRLRELTSAPAIALLNRPDEEGETALYEAGFDDVIVRPVRSRMLAARLASLRRRAQAPAGASSGEDKIAIGPFQLFPARLELKKADRTIHLTPLQARILYHLMANAGQTVPRERLEDKVYGYDGQVLSNALKTHICHLRQKLEDDPLAPRFICTVKGVGYSFQKPASRL